MRRDWDWPETTTCAWVCLIWCSEGREDKRGLILLGNIDRHRRKLKMLL
jgi:hypothetical protein